MKTVQASQTNGREIAAPDSYANRLAVIDEHLGHILDYDHKTGSYTPSGGIRGISLTDLLQRIVALGENEECYRGVRAEIRALFPATLGELEISCLSPIDATRVIEIIARAEVPLYTPSYWQQEKQEQPVEEEHLLWETKLIKYIEEVFLIKEHVAKISYREFTPGEPYNGMRLDVKGFDSVKTAIYMIEVLECPINVEYSGGRTINNLVVGVQDEKYIRLIGFRSPSGLRKEEDYGFRNDERASYRFGEHESFNWPTEPTRIDERLEPFFEELKREKPKAAESLEACMGFLRPKH